MVRGSIKKRSENSWWLRFDVTTGGKRKQRTATIRGSYKDAQKELTRLTREADTGMLVDPTRQTVGEYLSTWLQGSMTQSPKTKERYAELLRLQIQQHLGELALQKLRAEHIAEWHATLVAGGLSRQTTLHAHRVLALGLKRAVEHGTLARNPAATVKPPKIEQREIEILEPAQITRPMTGLADHPLYPIAMLALASGARRGELLALRWAALDLDRGVMHIERSVEETKPGLRLKPPKTKRGKRNIGLTAEAVAMLREHRKRQIELRLQLGQGGQPVLVFSTTDGELMSPDNFSRDWRRIIRARKLPLCSFHALRHTHASMLLADGVDVLTVSRRLGHSKASVTLDTYGHKIEGADQAATKAIERLLK